MVRAGSIQNVDLQDRLKKIGAIALALILVGGVGYFGYSKLNEGSKDEAIVPATSTSLPTDILETIPTLGFAVSQPAKVPPKFVRTNIELVEASRSGSGCEEVLQNYQGSDEPDFAFIDVYSYSADCSFPRPDDAEAFTIGDYSGWISEPLDSDDEDSPLGSVLFELTVNGAIARVETDFLRSEISPVLEQFVPFSATPPEDSAVITLSE